MYGVLRDLYKPNELVARADVNSLVARVLSTSILLGLIDTYLDIHDIPGPRAGRPSLL